MVAVQTFEVAATLVQISLLFRNIFESNVASNWEVAFTLSKVHQ
jgi:hypothetical protein